MADELPAKVLYRVRSMPREFYRFSLPVCVGFGLALGGLVVIGRGPWGFALLVVVWSVVVALSGGWFFAYALSVDGSELIWRTPLRHKRVPLQSVRAVVVGRLGRTIVRTDTRKLRLATPLDRSSRAALWVAVEQLSAVAPHLSVSTSWWT